MLMLAIENYLKITPELLKLSNVNHESKKNSSALWLALLNYYSYKQVHDEEWWKKYICKNEKPASWAGAIVLNRI